VGAPSIPQLYRGMDGKAQNHAVKVLVSGKVIDFLSARSTIKVAGYFKAND
jgi:hypothetical protein